MHMAPEATMVSNDHLQDVRLAHKHLVALGYSRIGLAIARSDDQSTQNRLTAGYFVEQTSLSSQHRVSPLCFASRTPDADASAALTAWVETNRIDAVLSSLPQIDRLLTDAGLRVPDRVACAGLAVINPKSSLAGVRPNLAMVGLKAVSLLDTKLKFGERGVPEFASTTYVQSVWQDGPTAPPKD
jgi:DNA-binding LacI/PurR family transcriptional regulator